MFHQNAQHTGLSQFQGPVVPFLKWRYKTSGAVDSPPAVTFGRIYLTSEDGNVYALNSQGVLLWTFRTGWPLRTTPAIGYDGTVYVAGCVQCEGLPNSNGLPEGALYAINPGGQLKWNLTVNRGADISSLNSPTIGPDGTIYLTDLGFLVLAVHPDGTVKWKVPAFGEVPEPPTLGFDGTVYVGVDDPPPSGPCGHCVMAINPDGTLKWTNGITGIAGPSPAIGKDGTIYTPGDAALFAFNPDGTVKWNVTGTFSSPSIGPTGVIYASERFCGCGVYAINPDGTVRWIFSASTTTTTAIGSDGTIFFGSGSNTLYSLRPNGTVEWRFELGAIGVSDPVIGSGGTIYVGGIDGNVYAIGNATTN